MKGCNRLYELKFTNELFLLNKIITVENLRLAEAVTPVKNCVMDLCRSKSERQDRSRIKFFSVRTNYFKCLYSQLTIHNSRHQYNVLSPFSLHSSKTFKAASLPTDKIGILRSSIQTVISS